MALNTEVFGALVSLDAIQPVVVDGLEFRDHSIHAPMITHELICCSKPLARSAGTLESVSSGEFLVAGDDGVEGGEGEVVAGFAFVSDGRAAVAGQPGGSFFR